MQQKIVLLGRSALLLTTARHLTASGFAVVAVVTDNGNPEYGVGPDDFAAYAEEVGASFAVVSKRSELAAVDLPGGGDDPPTLVSANWRYVLEPEFLGRWSVALNLHLGNLPDYKGNATINWSILDAQPHIYANVHRIAEGLDAGEVWARHAIELGPDTYVGDVLAETERIAGPLFVEGLRAARSGAAPVVPATESGLRCFPRLPEDGLIEWNRPAADVARLVRASSHPFPGAFTYLDGRRVEIWRAREAPAPESPIRAVPGHVLGAGADRGSLLVACGEGLLQVDELSADGEPVAPNTLVKGIRRRFSSHSRSQQNSN